MTVRPARILATAALSFAAVALLACGSRSAADDGAQTAPRSAEPGPAPNDATRSPEPGPISAPEEAEHSSAEVAPALPPESIAAQGKPCASGSCPPGLQCLHFYGIAGPRAPELTSCEVSCPEKGDCPGGQTCVTIADGPGTVCRPQPRR